MRELMRQPKVWVSAFILVIIGLHAVPVLFYQGFRQTRWPILAWAMYAKSYPPGPVETMRKRIVAVTGRGEQLDVGSSLVGISRAAVGKSYSRPLWDGDTAVAQELFRRLNRNRPDPIVELRLESEKFSVADTGLVTEIFPPIVYRAERPGH